MKRPATLFEVIGSAVGAFAAMLAISLTYINKIEASSAKTENHEVRIQQVEKKMEFFQAEYKQDMKELKDGQQEILIILQNKQDRK